MPRKTWFFPPRVTIILPTFDSIFSIASVTTFVSTWVILVSSTNQVIVHCFPLINIKASFDTGGEEVSSFLYRFIWFLLSATVLPFILPHLFSLITLIPLSAAFFCALVRFFGSCARKTPRSCSWKNSSNKVSITSWLCFLIPALAVICMMMIPVMVFSRTGVFDPVLCISCTASPSPVVRYLLRFWSWVVRTGCHSSLSWPGCPWHVRNGWCNSILPCLVINCVWYACRFSGCLRPKGWSPWLCSVFLRACHLLVLRRCHRRSWVLQCKRRPHPESARHLLP